MNKIITIVLNDDTSIEDADNLVAEIMSSAEYNMLIVSIKFEERDLEGECTDG